MCQIFNSNGAVQACAIWFHAWLLGGSTWPTDKSKNARKARNKIKKYDGKAVTCEYENITHWFVVLASGSIYCDNCMEKYGWQHLSAEKEAS